MLLQQFPNLQWIRQQSKAGFKAARTPQGKSLAKKEWPNVALWVNTPATERTKIVGSLSLFMNLNGNSLVQTEGRELSVNPDMIGISNDKAEYHLLVPNKATTFNLHFGPSLVTEVVSSLRSKMICEPNTRSDSFVTYPRTLFTDKKLRAKLHRLTQFYRFYKNTNTQREEELLIDILSAYIETDSSIQNQFSTLASLKQTTQQELRKKLFWAIDCLHAHLDTDISLDKLAANACLSKFHLLRTFKTVFGLTPFQYAAKIKAEKALEMVGNPCLSLQEIGCRLGFSEQAAFTRFFKSHFGQTPSQYRKSNLGQMTPPISHYL